MFHSEQTAALGEKAEWRDVFIEEIVLTTKALSFKHRKR